MAGFFLAKPPKDTRVSCNDTLCHDGGSFWFFHTKFCEDPGQMHPTVASRSNGGCCSGGWGPPSHHVPAYTPKRRGSRGSPNYSLLIIPLQRGSSIPPILASSQPSRHRACSSRDEAALPPGTLMQTKVQVVFAAVNERAWLEP